MTDDRLSDLFAQGTAPDRDPVFVASVAVDIGRARLRARLLELALPVTGALALSGALYLAAGMLKPVLGQLVEDAPQFMGAPAPAVLVVLLAGLAARARRYLLTR